MVSRARETLQARVGSPPAAAADPTQRSGCPRCGDSARRQSSWLLCMPPPIRSCPPSGSSSAAPAPSGADRVDGQPELFHRRRGRRPTMSWACCFAWSTRNKADRLRIKKTASRKKGASRSSPVFKTVGQQHRRIGLTYAKFDPLSDPLSGENCERWRPGGPCRNSTHVRDLRLRRTWRSLAKRSKTLSGLTLNQPVLGSSPRGLTPKSSSNSERPS